MKAFIHLRYIDLSGNKLKDISSLSVLTHLLTLKADNNLLVSAKLEEMPFLQIASFNKNKIKSLEGVNHPMLEHLSLNGKTYCDQREKTLSLFNKNALILWYMKVRMLHYNFIWWRVSPLKYYFIVQRQISMLWTFKMKFSVIFWSCLKKRKWKFCDKEYKVV